MLPEAVVVKIKKSVSQATDVLEDLRECQRLRTRGEAFDEFVKFNTPELLAGSESSEKILQVLNRYHQNRTLCMWKFLPANLRPFYHSIFRDLQNSRRTWSVGQTDESLHPEDSATSSSGIVTVFDKALNFYDITRGLRAQLKLRTEKVQRFHIFPDQRTV
jgi:hypothetical protein